MSLKSRFISVFASALVLGSAAVVASAQDQTPAPAVKGGTERAEKFGRRGFGRHGGFGKGMHGGRGFRELAGIELTDAQKTQIQQINDANKPDAAAIEEMKAIHEARRNGTLTEDQKARAKTLRDQMRTKGESVRQRVFAVLTPEQRQQIETRREEMRKRMEERRQQRQTQQPITPTKSDDN